ncbi:ATP-binding protein [Bradyrhizobium ganzhouense]|uniref:ATP-binding protein n=1 Tax=Bradyrhizobium ganzhouense TaxID=1179767 RepID=UPI003CED8669
MTKHSLVDPARYLGSVCFVAASTVKANMPFATANSERRSLARGVVGDFVFIDCDLVKLLGRIVEVGVPDVERLTIEPTLGKKSDTHPIGRILIFASVDQRQDKLLRGLRVHPKVGDSVYLADPAHFGDLIANALGDTSTITLELGTLDAGAGVPLRLHPEKVFGRHCGIFGATGGGKSWTLAKVIEQIQAAGGKALLFDPTGEFADSPKISKHYAFDAAEPGAIQVHFPYREMTEDDLFALFRPSGQIQGPKMREAIRSLKLVRILTGIQHALAVYQGRLLTKRAQPRAPFFNELNARKAQLHSPLCDFAIEDLGDQLQAECVYSTDFQNSANWGNVDQQALGYCEGLIARIRTLIHSNELACLFGEAGPSLATILKDFFENEDDDVLRISFKNVRFEHNTREILMNVIGRYVLTCARADAFREKPLIVLLDEAHQFLGRTIGDEYANVRLEAFGLIAKEGRKYGLTCVLATQRPRDIPPDVLSQLGTLIVHRLTNDDDRQAVERACGDLDRNAALFIPTLAPGEAIIIGPDLPAPVPINIAPPLNPPNSHGPAYHQYWSRRTNDRRP